MRGVRAWRDVTDLSLGGHTKEEIARAIEQESDAFVIYITPQCLTSDFIWNDEVPIALKRQEHDHAFKVIPIFRGVTPLEVQRFCAAHSLPSLTDFNGVSLPDSSISGTKPFNDALAAVAERTLRATFELRLRRVGADRNYEPCICFKTFAYEPPTPSLDLDLDWTGLFKSKDEVPTVEVWEEVLFPALQDVKHVLSEKAPSRKLHVFMQAILPAAFAFGFHFPASAHLRLLLEDDDHGTWSTAGTTSDPLPLHLVTYKDNGTADVAIVELALSRATAPGLAQSLPSLALSFKHHIRLEPLGGPDHLTAVKDAAHALAMAHQIGRELRTLCDSRGVSHIHLFAALPDDLAVMVGHQLNALCAITLYHYILSKKRYIPVCTLGKP